MSSSIFKPKPLAEGLAQVFRGDRDGVLGPCLRLEVLGVQRLVVGRQHLVEALEHFQDDFRLVLLHLALFVGLEQLVGQVAGLAGRVGRRIVQVPVGPGDRHTQVQLRGLGHLLEFLGHRLGELLHAVAVADDPLGGQIPLRHVHHVRHLVLVGHEEHDIILIGAVLLHAPLVLEELEHEVGRGGRLGGLDVGRVVVDDGELGGLGVVVHVGRLGREVFGVEGALLPDLLDPLVQLRLGLDLADHAHLVVDDLARGRLGLEAVTQAVVVEVPAAVHEPLHGLVQQRGIVVGLEHRQPQVGRIDAALARLHQAVQERPSWRSAGHRAADRPR